MYLLDSLSNVALGLLVSHMEALSHLVYGHAICDF